MTAFYYMLGAGLFSLASLILAVGAAWRLDHNHDDALRRRLDLLERQFDAELKVLVERVTELTNRADRNTEALERAVTAVAALTTRTERTERASHHHSDMDSFRKQKR